MKNFLKKIFKSHLYLNVFFYIFNKILSKIRLSFGIIESSSGTTHAALPLKESLAYIEGVFEDYCRVSGRKTFQGKLAELGPGDNDGVALMFLAHGATQAHLADRFYSKRDRLNHQKIYEALGEKYPKTLTGVKNVRRFYGAEAAGETFFQQNKGYDYIVSRSVLEHVDNPEIVLKNMIEALNPGGLLIHKVDLRDHGMYTPFSDPLKFLEVPTWLYGLMTQGTGYPNRFLFHRYKDILIKLNPKTQFYVAGLYGVSDLVQAYPLDKIPLNLKKKAVAYVNKYRHHFAHEFSDISAEYLMVSSFFFVCEKAA